MELDDKQLDAITSYCQCWTIEGAITILDREGWPNFTFDSMREVLEATVASGRIRKSTQPGYDYTALRRKRRYVRGQQTH